MPRRNRNAHALTINADVLADQASELSSELSQSDRIKAVLVWIDSWRIEIRTYPEAVTSNGRN